MAQIQHLRACTYDLKVALRRHWAKSVVIALATVALMLSGLLVMPPQYVSESTLFVRFAPDLVLDPSASAASQQLVREMRESELNSLLQALDRRTHLERVVDAIGSDAILRGQLPKHLGPPSIANEATREAGHERAVSKLKQNLNLSVDDGASTIMIRGTAETPQLAQRILATLVTLYMDEHLRQHRRPESSVFNGDEQQLLLEKQWNEASAPLSEAKNRIGILTVNGKRKLVEDQLAEVEIQLIRELFKYEEEERRLSAHFAAAHPEVRAIRGVISDLRKAMQTPAAEDTALPEVHGEEANLAIRRLVSTLGNQREQLRRQLAELNDQELQASQLEREAEVAQSRLASDAEKVEQVRIKQERFTELSIVQPASFSSKATGPHPLFVLAGLFVAVCGAMGLALVCYYADPLLRSPRDLERLGLPVAGPVPEPHSSLEIAV